MKPVHLFLILCTVAAWGFNFIASRITLEVFSPEQMAFSRSALTLIFLLPFWKPFQRIPWQMAVAALAMGTLAFYLYYEAVAITESLTTVAVATQLMPTMSALLAWLFFRERISGRKWTGVLVATAGAAYLAGALESGLSVLAFWLTILGTLAYSGGTVVIGKSPSVGIWRMLAWVSAISLPPLGLMAAASGPLIPDLELMAPRHWSALFFVVLISGLLGQAVLFHLYRNYPVATVAPWVLLIPVFAGLFSVLFYGESISFTLLLGGAVIIFGVWLQQRTSRRQADVDLT
jgi:O-acetylserine/cysteine efflux transporter